MFVYKGTVKNAGEIIVEIDARGGVHLKRDEYAKSALRSNPSSYFRGENRIIKAAVKAFEKEKKRRKIEAAKRAKEARKKKRAAMTPGQKAAKLKEAREKRAAKRAAMTQAELEYEKAAKRVNAAYTAGLKRGQVALDSSIVDIWASNPEMKTIKNIIDTGNQTTGKKRKKLATDLTKAQERSEDVLVSILSKTAMHTLGGKKQMERAEAMFYRFWKGWRNRQIAAKDIDPKLIWDEVIAELSSQGDAWYNYLDSSQERDEVYECRVRGISIDKLHEIRVDSWNTYKKAWEDKGLSLPDTGYRIAKSEKEQYDKLKTKDPSIQGKTMNELLAEKKLPPAFTGTQAELSHLPAPNGWTLHETIMNNLRKHAITVKGHKNTHRVP